MDTKEESGNIRRIFIAVPVPASILSLQDELRETNARFEKIKWTRNPNLHLTVYFIGNVPGEKNEVIKERLSVLTHIATIRAKTLANKAFDFFEQ